MTVDVDRGTGDNRQRLEGRSHVTVIGAPLKARAFSAVAGRIADTGANIDRIERMARYPVTAIDLFVSGADTAKLRSVLSIEAAVQGLDIAVQPANLSRHGMRLVVLDVDSTLIQGEVIEMLAAHAGVESQVAEVTDAAMRGDLDFEDALRDRVARLEGLDAAVLDEVYDDIVLTPGVRTMVRTLRRLGYRFAIVSGGFSQITDRLAADLGIHYARANELEIVDGKLTGRIVGDVVDRAGKASALRQFAADVGVPLSAVVAIGDGANDLDMLNAAGLGIAYNAKPVLREAADTSSTSPTSTRSCTSSASVARRSRPPTPPRASPPPLPRSDAAAVSRRPTARSRSAIGRRRWSEPGASRRAERVETEWPVTWSRHGLAGARPAATTEGRR